MTRQNENGRRIGALACRPLREGLRLMVLAVAGAGVFVPLSVFAADYSPTLQKELTLTVSQGASVTHTLTPVVGLSDGSVETDTLLATGSFSGTASRYGFKWVSRDAGCGTDPACSRVKSQEDAANYIDMIARFTAPATTSTDPALPDYVMVNLGSGTSGGYTLRHLTGAAVKAGTYRVNTEIGVYTP